MNADIATLQVASRRVRRWDLDKITERIIGCSFTVGNTLECGFLEKVYENALAYELRQTGLLVEQQYEI